MAKHDSSAFHQAYRPTESRDTLALSVLMDPLDIRCQFCPGQSFRRSKVRLGDLPGIALMRYPVRCMRCGQRQAVSFTVAGMSARSQIMSAQVAGPDDSWRKWTQTASPRVPEEAVRDDADGTLRMGERRASNVDRRPL